MCTSEGEMLGVTIDVKEAETIKGPEDGAYRNCVKPRGVALIINYKKIKDEDERSGSEIDLKNLEQLFGHTGYKIHKGDEFIKANTSQEVLELFERFCNDKIHDNCDSLIVCIMSHGIECKFKISSGELVNVRDVLAIFNKCKSLKLKPKLFIYQICRQLYLPRRDESLSFKDCFVIFSSSPGQKSHRHIHYGGLFVIALCKAFMKYSADKNITELKQLTSAKLDEIQNYMKENEITKQYIDFQYNPLCHNLFLNPVGGKGPLQPDQYCSSNQHSPEVSVYRMEIHDKYPNKFVSAPVERLTGTRAIKSATETSTCEIGTYNNDSGLILIIENITPQSQASCELQGVYTDMGYEVYSNSENFTTPQKLVEFVRDFETKINDLSSFTVILSFHGSSESFYFKDGTSINFVDSLKLLSANTQSRKPKVFIVLTTSEVLETDMPDCSSYTDVTSKVVGNMDYDDIAPRDMILYKVQAKVSVANMSKEFHTCVIKALNNESKNRKKSDIHQVFARLARHCEEECVKTNFYNPKIINVRFDKKFLL